MEFWNKIPNLQSTKRIANGLHQTKDLYGSIIKIFDGSKYYTSVFDQLKIQNL